MAKGEPPRRKAESESFAAIAEHAPAMLWRGDAQGRCIYLNKAQREFWGVAADKIDAFSWSDTLLPEDTALVFAPFSEGMAMQRRFECQARYRRADGAVRILNTCAEPYFDETGAFSGMVGVNTDVTEQLAAQAELSEKEARLRALADNLPFGMVFQITAAPDGSNKRFSFVSNQCAELNGVSAQEAMGDPAALYNLILPEYQPAFSAAERAAADAGDKFVFEAPMRVAGGETRWFRIASAPRKAPSGEIIWDGVQIDIDDAKRVEERRGLVMGEMSHRFKNMLSAIIAIAAQTGRSAASMAEFNTAFQARLHALSQSHNLLQRDASDSADLRDLLELELGAYVGSCNRRLSLNGAPVRLDGQRAIGFTLIVHELATNAAKYGAFSGDGEINVSWAVKRARGRELVCMTWLERGGPVPKKAKQGFGTRLIEAVTKGDLNGECDMQFEPEGLRAEFRFAPRG